MQLATGSRRQTARNAVPFSFACVLLALEVVSGTMILQLEVSGRTASRSRASPLRQCHGSRGSGPPVFRHKKLENAVSRVLQGSPGHMTEQVLNPVPGSGWYRYRRENHPRCDIWHPPP
jgi:hypothetical protein